MNVRGLPPDVADALTAARSRLPAGLSLRHFPEVESTNDLALRLAASGAGEGTAILADAQSGGRGRRGRAWFSPPGAGLYLSCVVLGGRLGAGTSLLTLAAGVAAAQSVIAVAGLPVELKWPNDLVIGRPWRKLAGILCESTGVSAHADAVVVGLGVNLLVAAYPPVLARHATSIEAELGRPVERAPLVIECLVRLLDVARRLRAGGSGEVLDEWRRLGGRGLAGAVVRWQDQRGERRGRVKDIDVDGALLVESGGRMDRIIAGDVTWEQPS
jgi:BirA family biotin operon repressor/biotin-[acetyl-CoA-carboxylase] ligase